MPSKVRVVEKLLIDAGKSDAATRREIERAVGEITLEMLEEGDGRFSDLARPQTISVTTTERYYKLNPDFFTTQDEHEVLDSDGEFSDTFTIYPKQEILRRKREGERLNCRVCHIEKLQANPEGSGGSGWYLVLSYEAAEAATYVLEYFREPTENDVAAIKNEAMLYSGVRGMRPDIFGERSAVDMHKYLAQLPGHSEKVGRYFGAIPHRPSYRAVAVNKLQHKSGRGY